MVDVKDELRPIPPKMVQLLEAGAPFGDAVKVLLADRDRAAGEPEVSAQRAITRFASRHRLSRPNTSAALHGHRPLTWEVATKLADDLGGTPDEWRELHGNYARQVRATA